MNIKEIRDMAGLSQASFAQKYAIPVKSIQNWEQEGQNHRDPPAYLIQLLERVVKEDFCKNKK